MHTVIKVAKDSNQAVVACRTPNWECLVVDLPSCNLLKTIMLDAISLNEECRLIRSSIQNYFYLSIWFNKITPQKIYIGQILRLTVGKLVRFGKVRLG